MKKFAGSLARGLGKRENRISAIKIYVFSFFLLCFFLPVSRAAKVKIVEEGQPSSAVVLAADPTATAEFAAREFVRHVKLATGAVLPVVYEPDIPGEYESRIFIGNTNAASMRGIDPKKLGMDETLLLASGSDLFIAGYECAEVNPLNSRFLAFHIDYTADGPSYSGVLFGVYELLERYLDAVWAWPGELGTYVPARRNFVIEDALDERFSPELKWRILHWSWIRRPVFARAGYPSEDRLIAFSRDGLEHYANDLKLYLRRHRAGWSERKPNIGHEFHRWWGRYGEENPEWFALNEGAQRRPPRGSVTSMCVSNPSLHEFIIDRWDGKRDIRLGEADARWSCVCEDCRAWDAPLPAPGDLPEFFLEGGEIREGSFYNFPGWTSDRYARFWKTIYDKAAQKNPDAVVTTFLYYSYFPAPAKTTELGSGIVGEFVQWGDAHLNWFPMREDAYEWLEEQWLGWRDTGIVMAYRPNYLHDGWIMPHVETRQSGEFFKFAYDNGMVGASFDSLCGQWAAQGPKLYLHARLLAKPWLEIDDILDEYYSVFGPAEAEVREYFGYWEDYAYANMERFVDIYRDVGNRWQRFQLKAHEAYPPESFEPAEEILGRAHEAASAHPEPEYARRVEFLKAGLEHAKLGGRLAAVFDGRRNIPRDSERFPEAVEALAELADFRREHEDKYIFDFLSAARKERRFWNVDQLIEEDVTFDLPAYDSGWLFAEDPGGDGMREGWYGAGYNPEEWREIDVPAFWADTWPGDYLGYGWYRSEFHIPADEKGKNLELFFEGVDEQAWVFVNGRLAGEHTVASEGKGIGELWDEPFMVEICSDNLNDGEENLLVVMVHASAYNGGIWMPIYKRFGSRE